MVVLTRLVVGLSMMMMAEGEEAKRSFPLSKTNPLNFNEPFFYAEVPASKLVEAGSGFNCKIPEVSSLFAREEARSEDASRALEADALLDYGRAEAERHRAEGIIYRPELERYALGDCFRARKKCGSESEWGRETLGMAYLNATESGYDYALLEELIDAYRERHDAPIPAADTLVIHLRLGDVIRLSRLPADYLLVCSGPAYRNHTQVKSVYEYLYDAKKTNLTTVVLVGGSHTTLELDDDSWFYALAIKRAFEVAGYDTSLRLEPRPDEDFIYMSRAKNFIQGAGGYSYYASKLAEMNGGKIWGRRYYHERLRPPAKDT